MADFFSRLFSLFNGDFEDQTVTKLQDQEPKRSLQVEMPKKGQAVCNPSSRYLAFDIEISKILPGDFSQWKNHRPLGISCAALKYGTRPPEVWYSQTANGKILYQMSISDLQQLVHTLEEAVDLGWKIVTWNGLGFDFDVLAEESQSWNSCRYLALNHIDLMFHFFCLQGYPLSLNKAATGMGLIGKMAGMTGAKAPILWAQGDYAKVIDYVSQDVQTTWELAELIAKYKIISWTSNCGNAQQAFFTDGLLKVNSAIELPLVMNSWMSDGIKRDDFLSWTSKVNQRYDLSRTNYAEKMRPTVDYHSRTNPVTNKRIQSELTPEEINAIFVQAEIERDFGFFDTADDDNDHDTTYIHTCNCAICRGDPGGDFVYKFMEEIDRENNYYQDNDYWYDDERW